MKNGYKRKSVDLKESTLKKIGKKAIDMGIKPKELCEQVLEEYFNPKEKRDDDRKAG
jgi:hypothetical protein